MNLKLGALAYFNILRTGPTGGARVLHLGGRRDMCAGDLGRDVQMSFLPTGGFLGSKPDLPTSVSTSRLREGASSC